MHSFRTTLCAALFGATLLAGTTAAQEARAPGARKQRDEIKVERQLERTAPRPADARREPGELRGLRAKLHEQRQAQPARFKALMRHVLEKLQARKAESRRGRIERPTEGRRAIEARPGREAAPGARAPRGARHESRGRAARPDAPGPARRRA